MVGLQVPQAGLDTPAFNATVEAKAAVMLAGMAGGDALRKPCGTYSGRCCRAMRQLACRMAAAEAARELTPSIPLEATLACDALTPTTAFATCNSTLHDCSIDSLQLSAPLIHYPASVSVTGRYLSPFVLHRDSYCAYLTGVNETAWKAPATSLALALKTPIAEEDSCPSGGYWRLVHDLESSTNISAFKDACSVAVLDLKFGGHLFGPPSQWEEFGAVCRSCSRYTVLLDGLTASSSCNCEKFQYGMCPHLTPEAMLCDLYQICYDHKEYQAKYCAGDACGVTARDEDTWRKCGARRQAHLSLIVASVMSIAVAWTAFRLP